ncbi:MAG TPA: tetratricopeptide repeat protein [Thermoanaerobaculia bacterium]
MKRILLTAAALAIVAAGCSLFHQHSAKSSNPYDNPFYMQWVTSKRGLDPQIRNTVAALRANPSSAPLHNQLGQLLVAKGFPKDAEREFERAVNADGNFYQAWYNLGLIRAAHDDYSGAERAFHRTVRLAKGHAEALFQLGLIEEERGNDDAAVDYYVKALRHNPQILDVRVNPRVLDSKLMQLALLKNYELDHSRQASRFLGTPPGYVAPAQTQPEAPSPQATPQQIVTPAPPVTETGTQRVPPRTTT